MGQHVHDRSARVLDEEAVHAPGLIGERVDDPQAAADGVGVAMGISPYADDDLKAGRLVAPFKLSVSKGEHWYLIYRAARKDEAVLQAFRAWINRAARR
jgi:DNA-binding transcriptional LysR family regulator